MCVCLFFNKGTFLSFCIIFQTKLKKKNYILSFVSDISVCVAKCVLVVLMLVVSDSIFILNISLIRMTTCTLMCVCVSVYVCVSVSVCVSVYVCVLC